MHLCTWYLSIHLHSTESLMESTVQLVVFLLWSLVEVHSQTAPYISFRGETLPNHAYVNVSLVGNDDSGSDSVQCHTDLFTCCTPQQGQDSGDWYHPDMTIVPLFDEIYVVHRAERVDLRRIRIGMILPYLASIIVILKLLQSTVIILRTK